MIPFWQPPEPSLPVRAVLWGPLCPSWHGEGWSRRRWLKMTGFRSLRCRPELRRLRPNWWSGHSTSEALRGSARRQLPGRAGLAEPYPSRSGPEMVCSPREWRLGDDSGDRGRLCSRVIQSSCHPDGGEPGDGTFRARPHVRARGTSVLAGLGPTCGSSPRSQPAGRTQPGHRRTFGGFGGWHGRAPRHLRRRRPGAPPTDRPPSGGVGPTFPPIDPAAGLSRGTTGSRSRA